MGILGTGELRWGASGLLRSPGSRGFGGGPFERGELRDPDFRKTEKKGLAEFCTFCGAGRAVRVRFSRDWEGLRLWRLRIVLFLVRGFILGLSDAGMGVCTYRQLLPVFLRPSCRHRVKGE